jgi:hypothetical protein
MRKWNWAHGMAQVVARRWSSLTALNPRTGKFFWRDYSTNRSGLRLLDLFFLPEYPLVIFSRYLQQVPSDAIALRIMSFARMCSGLS